MWYDDDDKGDVATILVLAIDIGFPENLLKIRLEELARVIILSSHY